MKKFAVTFLCAAVLSGFTAQSVRLWTPDIIASDQFESHPAFDPLTGDLYFVRSSPQFSGWQILVSRCGPNGLEKPAPPVFAGDGVEADPFFADNGKTLYFISTRTSDGITRKDLDIWRIDRDAQGKWQTPQRLPAPINSAGHEWFPRPAVDGWLYFGSDRPGGFGKTDIWRGRLAADGHWIVENAGAALNTAADEYEPLPSADGTRMILQAGDAYYESTRTKDGWSPRVKLDAAINANGSEIGALLSPDGKSLLFARDAKDGKSGELFLAREAGAAPWPAVCPQR